MPTNRIPLRRPFLAPLSHAQEMALWLGELRGRPAFCNEEERRELWFRHRDRLLALCGPGRRPAGWWLYESPIRRPTNHDYESAALYEAGLLTKEESVQVVAMWREQFERAQAPDFAHCIGHAKPGDTFASWLYGTAAKRAHYRWAGIPHSLVRKWAVKRRRRVACSCWRRPQAHGRKRLISALAAQGNSIWLELPSG